MTLARGILTVLLPLCLGTFSIAELHRHGFWRCMRAVAASVWALSFALPRCLRCFRATFRRYYLNTMRLA